MSLRQSDCEWKRVTDVVIPGLEDGGHVKELLAAMLTTYEQPEPDVLVEELFPHWLDLERGSADLATDRNERLKFYLELELRLKDLRGKLAVFSTYSVLTHPHWLWQYVRPLYVGRTGPATQHSKIWLFHWKTSAQQGIDRVSPELLQVVISSANLTSAGLKGQIQAGWSVTLPLNSRGSKSRLKSWGLVPGFLEALGQSSGRDGERQIEYWINLLGRADAPPNTSFVASVPGKHPLSTLRRTATSWGAAGLGRVELGGKAAIEVRILVPTVGEWTRKDLRSLKSWLGHNCILKLVWIKKTHGWQNFWVITPKARRALQEAEVTALSLPDFSAADISKGSPLHVEHDPTDRRWCHAKLYRFRRGNGKRLLITSANFSPAAWGRVQPDGGLKIENFELGVLLESDHGRLNELAEMHWNEAWASEAEEKTKENDVVWVDAYWSGTQIRIECRLSIDVKLQKDISVRFVPSDTASEHFKLVSASWTPHGRLWSSRVNWTETLGIPKRAALKLAGGVDNPIEVLIADDRRHRPDKTVIPELLQEDPKLLKALELLVLEEKYGGGLLEGINGNVQTANSLNGNTSNADYRIPITETARRRWHVIDAWVEKASPKQDGKRLYALWNDVANNKDASSTETVSARAAASEIAARLKESES